MEDQQERSKQEEFITKKYIGQGTFGKVEKCIRKEDDRLVAVKIIDTIIEVQLIREEAQMMMRLKSDYTVELLDHFPDSKLAAYILVMPFYRKGNLSGIMHRVWSSQDIILLLYQIQRAFIQMYKNKIWHLDLKPDNILVKAEGEYLVCDFGCAKMVDNPKVSNVLRMSMSKGGGTTDYASPELVLDFKASKYSDMWSLGVILYEILYKKHPLKSQNRGYTMILQDYIHGKVSINYPPKQGYQSLIELCKKMLAGSAQKIKRLTWQQLGDEIFSMLKLTKVQNRISLITDINQLISYAGNINTIVSGLIYYLEMRSNRDFLISNNAKPDDLILTAKIYMNRHICTIEKALKDNSQLEYYYIFPTTLRGYTESRAVKITHFVKRTYAFTKEISRQEMNGKQQQARLNFKSQCEQFYNKVKYLQNSNPKSEWFKITNVLKGILKGTSYENKENLKQLALELTYN